MPTLSARFREVTLTLSEPAGLPASVPITWLQLQHSGHTVRFVHAQADTEPIEAQIRDIYPSAAAINLEPMNLRSIFLAIAKSSRTASQEGVL